MFNFCVMTPFPIHKWYLKIIIIFRPCHQPSQITTSDSSKFCTLMIWKQRSDATEEKKNANETLFTYHFKSSKKKAVYNLFASQVDAGKKNPEIFDKSKHPIWRWAIITYFMEYSARVPLTSSLFTHSTKQSGKKTQRANGCSATSEMKIGPRKWRYGSDMC